MLNEDRQLDSCLDVPLLARIAYATSTVSWKRQEEVSKRLMLISALPQNVATLLNIQPRLTII